MNVASIRSAKSWTAPERERLVQQNDGELTIAGGARASRLANEPLEAEGVELIGPEMQNVARRARLEPFARVAGFLEQLPQLRDVHLETGCGRRRRALIPQRIDQAVPRNDFVRVQ